MLQIEIPWKPENTDASPSKVYAIRSSALSGCTCDETGSQKKKKTRALRKKSTRAHVLSIKTKANILKRMLFNFVTVTLTSSS